MADVRDLILSERPRIGISPSWRTFSSGLRLLIRRAVVATSFPPIRSLYGAIYRAHIRYAARTLRQVPGVRSVYVARGAVSKDVVYGVSDIDLLVFGEWSKEQEDHFTAVFQRLLSRSPLYDHTAAAHVNTVESLRTLSSLDYYFQFRFDWARTQSELVFGEDILSTLPPLPPERAGGGYYMELRLMWMMFMTSAFGSGPTATDTIFRNSIAFKSAATTLNMEEAFAGRPMEYSRKKVIESALVRAEGADHAVLQRLVRCWQRRYQRYEGDVQNDSFRLLLCATERIHQRLYGTPPFDALPGMPLEIDAPAPEVVRFDATKAHAQKLMEHVKRNWQGYRSTFLLPRNSFAGLDELQLLIDVDPATLPTIAQIRELCRLHALEKLPQRLALYLLLPQGAYQLERQSPLEFWQVLLAPAANPETFALLSRAEFVLDGNPRPAAAIHWTRFAATQIEHELTLRRSALGNANRQGPMNPLHLLRAVWRQLQLEVIQRSLASGKPRFPLTVPAVRRGMQTWGLPDVPILQHLETAYQLELEGKPSTAAQLIPEAFAFFSRFEQARTADAVPRSAI